MRAALLPVAGLVALTLLLQADQPPAPAPLSAKLAASQGGFVRFEENLGQWHDRVDFLARIPGARVFLASGDAVFAVAGRDPTGTERQVSALRLRFEGGAAAAPAAEGELPGRSHYLIGPHPAAWHTDIRHVERVRYPDLYPGIDLLYRGGSGFEFDLIVSPGADPARIRFRLDGADSVLAEDGRLVARLPTGRVALEPPRVYQELNGGRQSVAGRFRLRPAGEVSFEVGEYDPTRPLTIDPLVLVYSSYAGGSGSETATGIAVDRQGMLYATGRTFSADFPVKGATQAAPASGEDAYVLKVNPAASGAASLIYATYLGSSARDGAEAIAVDSGGQAFVTGWTHAGDFPVTATGFKPTFTPSTSDESDAFVAILNPAGNGLTYGSFFGGSTDEEGMGIVPSGDSSLVLAGGTDGGNFPTTASAFDAAGQIRSVFVSVLNWRSNTLRYSTVYHASPNIQLQARGLAVDGAGRAHVTGLARGAGLPVVNGFMTTFPPDATSSFGRLGSFLAVFDPAQSGAASLVYATYLGAGDAEDVAADSKGRSVVVGSSSAPAFPTTTGAFQATCQDLIIGSSNLGCQRDAFVMVIDPAASSAASLAHATRLGGVRAEDGMGVAVDAGDSVLVTGSTSSAGFPVVLPLAGTSQRPDGEADGFVAKLTPTLSSLVFSTRIGGVTNAAGTSGASDRGVAVAVAPDGGTCVAGETSASDFPTVRAFDATLGGFSDAFVLKLGMKTCPAPAGGLRPGPSLPFVWEPPFEICLTWPGQPGAPGTFPERCPPPECPRCGAGLSPERDPGPMPDPLTQLYREAGGVLLGGGLARRAARREDYRRLIEAVRQVPEGQFFTARMKETLLGTLGRGGPMLKTRLRRQLAEALNAMELDWRDGTGHAMDQKAGAAGYGAARLPRGAGEVALELTPGLPALPSGVHTGWPLVSYRVPTAQSRRRAEPLEVELYAGWMGFGEAGELRMLAWNGKRYRDVTGVVDPLKGRITGRIDWGDVLVVVRAPFCKMP
jgi:hypothetical protein